MTGIPSLRLLLGVPLSFAAWASPSVAQTPPAQTSPAQTSPAQTSATQTSAASPAAWQFNLSSFAWLPSVTGSATVRGHEVVDNASFEEIVRKSDSLLAFSGHAEARYDRFGVFVEPIWMRIGMSSSSDLVHAKFVSEITYVELGGFYRVFEGLTGRPAPLPWHLDVLGGARYTDLSASATFALAPSFSQSKSWVDPFIGARVLIGMTHDWDFHLRADIGGFGVGSQFSWNLVALVGYHFDLFGTPAEAFGGYKALYQDYRSGSGDSAFRWDNILSGPVLGLTVTF